MADWSEIEKLQEAFQRTQKSTTAQKLSERNCIEILSKLQDMKLIDVIHTQDGKEYLTPKHLSREIRDEIYIHGGRVNLVEIQQALNVDFTHIEAKANELVKSDRNLQLILGQIIQSTYLDQLAEDINDTLQSSGQITIAEISKSYDLPGDFLLPELTKRMGQIIDGQIDQHNKDAIFTKAFIARHKGRIRGILSAVTRPLMLSAITSECDISIKLLFTIVEELLDEGRIKGQMTGGRSEKSTFLPEIHTQTQNQWIDNFFSQNNYVEFDAVSRLGISDSPSYLKRRLGSERKLVFLQTLCTGEMLVDRVVASIDETLAAGDWIDAMTLLPTSFTDDDCHQLLVHVQQSRKKDKSAKDFLILDNTNVCNPAFVDSCQQFFTSIINVKADQEAKKSSVLALTEEERKVFLSAGYTDPKSSDRKEDRKKKVTEGSGSTKSGGGTGVGAREAKTKGKDKKRLKWKKEQEEKDEKTTSHKQKSTQDVSTFLSVDEIADILHEKLPQCPDGFVQEIAAKLNRPLQKSYQSAVQSVFLMTAQKQNEPTQEDGDKKADEKTSEKPRRPKSRRQFEEEINAIWTMARLSSESVNCFNDDVGVIIQKHILKTVCTDLTNAIFLMMASEFMSNVEIAPDVTQETRLKMLPRFPKRVRTPLSQLNNSLTGKSFEEFTEVLNSCAEDKAASFMLKPGDKKKDRQFSHGHKISILNQLEVETDPALVLHLCSSVIFQTLTGNIINAPGKLVPTIISYIHPLIEKDVQTKLQSYQNLIMEKISLQSKGVPTDEAEQELSDRIDEIKKLASSTKKRQQAS